MSNVPLESSSEAAPREDASGHPVDADPLSRIEALLSDHSGTNFAQPTVAAPEVRQSFGAVEGREGSSFLVRLGSELVHARRAKGCLVEPETGDTVLVARCVGERREEQAFVLSVLVGRTDEGASVIDVDGDLTLRSRNGRVAIAGNEGVSITSGGEVAVNAPSIAARTMKASLFADSLSYLGRTVDAHIDRVKVIGQSLETVIDHVSARMKHSFRTIDELERVKVKELHVNAEATLNLHGKNTLMTAEKLVKLDGEQISIG